MMPKPKPYARIAITLPQADLAAADKLAKAQDRSRSWIIAEAVRRYAAEQTATEATSTGLDPSRAEQLRRDLALSPEERVRVAEETARMAALGGEPLQFENYDAYLAWATSRNATA